MSAELGSHFAAAEPGSKAEMMHHAPRVTCTAGMSPISNAPHVLAGANHGAHEQQQR